MSGCNAGDGCIAVIGAGRIGATTAIGLAHLGWKVDAIDRLPERLATLAGGWLPETEPGLRAALKGVLPSKRLSFRQTPREAAYGAVFLCVDTPPLSSGAADLRQVFEAAKDASRALADGGVLVTRSTIPVGTGDWLQAELHARGRCDITVVHLPEFLREGHAWEDFTCADRIVIGGESEEAVTRIQRLFALLGRPLFLVDRRTAELAKYANNAFLATSVSFANEIGDLADTLGANAAEVFGILRADRRIGPRAYLTPGLGFGGHCLPKDAAALEYLAQAHGRPLAQLRATLRVNENRPSDAAAWLRGVLCGLGERRICMAGLAFKPGSEDLRESPMLALAKVLCSEGAVLSAWDPNVRQALQGIDLCCWIEDALLNADALVLGQATEPWRELEPLAVKALMRRPIVYDAPGALEASRWTASGFLMNRGSKTRTLKVGG